MKRSRFDEVLFVALSLIATAACSSRVNLEANAPERNAAAAEHATMDHGAHSAHAAAGHDSDSPALNDAHGTHGVHAPAPIEGLWGKIGAAPTVHDHPAPGKLTPLSPDAFDLPSATSVAEADRARGSKSAGHAHSAHAAASGSSEKAQRYVCPMHPDVVSNAAGKCPKCGMALVKKGEK